MKKDKNKTNKQKQKAVSAHVCPVANAWRHADTIAFAMGFLLLWIFSTFIYGDVFHNCQQESFVCNDPIAMKFLTDVKWGGLFLFGRFLLLIFKSKWIGGLIYALLLTLSAWILSKTLNMTNTWKGICFMLPFAILTYLTSKGVNIFYQAEPSIIILIPVAAICITTILFLATRLRPQKTNKQNPYNKTSTNEKQRPYGLLTLLVMVGGVYAYALIGQQNTIITSKMQTAIMDYDFDEMVDLGASARQPSRTIAAYYAVGLFHTHQLLTRLFDIPFNYKQKEIDFPHSGSEYDLFKSDIDFETGLIQPSYHYATERMTMNGTSTRMLKRSTLCCLLLQQPRLAEKYLALLDKEPFENSFVDKCRNYIQHPELIQKDSHFALLLQLKPKEKAFEQNYRQPTFMGYHIKMLSGATEALPLTVAACLYTKDLQNAAIRLSVMKQQGYNLPTAMQEALACASLKNPQIEKAFKLSPFIMSRFHAFLKEASIYKNDKEALRKNMKKNWIGSYFYYYFCENNNPGQTTNTYHETSVN